LEEEESLKKVHNNVFKVLSNLLFYNNILIRSQRNEAVQNLFL